MRKPAIKDIRRAYVLDILLRFAPVIEGAYPEGFPQKEIVIYIIEQQYGIKIVDKGVNGEYEIVFDRERGDDLERKLITAVSKTVNSLERDGIITITSLRTPGKRGAHQNIININKTPEALYKILNMYDKSLLGEGLVGERFSFNFKFNLLTSEYYKGLVNMDLVNELTGSSELPYNEEDKILIYHLILASPEALKSFLSETYGISSYFKFYDKDHLNDYLKSQIEMDGGESLKNSFIGSIQVDFIKEVKEYYNIPNFNIKIDINVRFKDKKDKTVYEFFNEFEGAGREEGVNYPFFDFV